MFFCLVIDSLGRWGRRFFCLVIDSCGGGGGFFCLVIDSLGRWGRGSSVWLSINVEVAVVSPVWLSIHVAAFFSLVIDSLWVFFCSVIDSLYFLCLVIDSCRVFVLFRYRLMHCLLMHVCVCGGGGGGGRVIAVWLSIQVDFFFCLVIDSNGLFLLFGYRFKWAFSSVWLSIQFSSVWLSVHVFFSPLSFGYRFMFFFLSLLLFLFFFIYFLSIHVVPRPSPSAWLSIRLFPPLFSLCLVIDSPSPPPLFFFSVWLSSHVGFFFFCLVINSCSVLFFPVGTVVCQIYAAEKAKYNNSQRQT